MGEVWLGRHVVSGGLGAVKVLREGRGQRDRMRRYFAREGRAIARLSHPHIVPVFEISDDHIVTAYVDGADLERRLRSPIVPASAVLLIHQIASALAHAHERGVIHRDVKPSNILIDRRGNSYLADFGLAILAEDGAQEAARAGTPAFMAPEQVRGEKVGPAADQYGLGRCLLEMLVGARPPLEPEWALCHIPDALPSALRAAVGRATAPVSEDRFPSMAAFAEALGALDLTDYPAPSRLAPEVRLRSRFAWCTHAHTTVQVAPDLMRADYRLSEVRTTGSLNEADTAAFLASRGLAEVGWSVYGRSAQLGPIVEPAAWARASEAVVLLHGWAVTRRVWETVAAGICRDNAQAVVLVPDVHGHGETNFAAPWPKKEHASVRSFMRGVIDWLDLLGMRDFPTVLVGHSMSALGLLSVTDDELGPRVSRVIINPVFPHYDPPYRRRLYTAVVLGHTLARIKRLQPWLVRKMVLGAPAAQELPVSEREKMAAVVSAMTAGATAGLLASFRDSRPAHATHHHRMLLLHGENDPLVSEEVLTRALTDMGLPNDRVRRLATGGHYPHMESEAHPEHTARNCAEIVHLVDTMLLTASEGSMLSMLIETPTVSDTSTASPPGIGTSSETTRSSGQ